MVGIIHQGKIVDSGSIDYLQKKIEGSSTEMTVAFQMDDVADEVLSSFGEMDGIKAAQKVGKEYFFRVDSKKRIPEVNNELVRNKIGVYSINVKHVSSEDIYLNLTGGGGK